MNFEKLHALYHQPFFDLISQSRAVHLEHWRGESVQRCSLLSIKTGGCGGGCPSSGQSAPFSTSAPRAEFLSLGRNLLPRQQRRGEGVHPFLLLGTRRWRAGRT